MEYIPVVLFIGIVLFAVCYGINWIVNKLSEKPARIAKLAAMVVLVAMFLAGVAYGDTVEGKITFVTPIIEEGEAIAIVDVDTVDGNCWQYEASGRIAVNDEVVLTIVDGKVVAVDETKEETPNQLPALIGCFGAIAFIVIIIVYVK